MMIDRDSPSPAKRRLSVTLLGVAAALAGGCGQSGLSHVEGVVSVGGKPLSTGRIQFVPESGRRASSWIAEDGSYELTTFDPGDGAAPGEYKVIVEANDLETIGERPTSLSEEMSGDFEFQTVSQSLVPSAYTRTPTSPLTAVVEAGYNEIDFDLEQD